jgi:hypothetical protein
MAGTRQGGGPSLLPVLALAAALAAGACTEDALTGPVPESQEDVSETVELTLAPGELASWRDTTFTGFADVSSADFLLLADRSDLVARGLLRYEALPDSVLVDGDTVEVESFVSGEIQVSLDTVASVRPDQGGFTLRLFELSRPFVASEATWSRAAAGEPWSTEGGDLGRELGALEVTELTDSIFASTLSVPISTDTEAVLEAWRTGDGEPGAALVLEGAGARFRVTSAALQAEAKPVGRDTTVELRAQSRGPTGSSAFIHDPPLPAPGASLRLGGLPASRFYLTFEPPRSVDELQLPRSTINRAEIVFRPEAPPPAQFRPDRPVTARGIRLGTDPFETGPKTPIGGELGSASLDPDSLAAGSPIRISVTSLLSSWATNPDSAGRLRLGVRLVPDGQVLGFWSFGSRDAPPELQPFLRLVVTPPSDFEVP